MLDKIVEDVRRRLPALQACEADLRASAGRVPDARDFASALSAPHLSVIAEIKRASPSLGPIHPHLDAGDQARKYARGGASALSVLTEPGHFNGSAEDLEEARAATSVPTLRKDFTLHPVHIWESKAMGADAVLLIVAILDDAALASLLTVADEAGLAALVEVHDEGEAQRAMTAGARIIGVNNRDLQTFEVDLGTAEAIAPLLSDAAVTVAESGIHGPEDARRMRDAGYDAVLVGEYLVRSGDPARAIQELRSL